MTEPRPRGSGRTVLLTVLMLGLALALRLTGLGWGLPNALHQQSYHPDEWQVALGALRMVVTGDPNPHFFNYPTLSLYLAAGLDYMAAALRHDLPLAPLCYLLPRALNVLFGVGTVVLTGLLGTSLLGRLGGWVAALLLAVAPLAVVNSHYATVDTGLAFWCMLALLAATQLSQAVPERRRRWLLLGAVASGLAVSTKYNGLLAVVPLGVAWLWPETREDRTAPVVRVLGLLALVAVALLVFVLTSPYVLIDPHAWPAIRFELFEHPRATNLFNGVGPGWWFHLRWNLPTAFGWLSGGAALLGIGLLSRRRAAWPLLGWLLLVALSLGRTRELYLRYLLPSLPALAVTAAAVPARWASRPKLAVAILLLLVLGPALRSRALVAMLSQPDARDVAARWCFREIPAASTVGSLGVADQLWYWSVPLRPNNGGPRTAGAGAEPERYQLRLDPAQWSAEPPDWLVVNLTQVQQQYRGQPGEWAELTRGYTEIARFENTATVLPGWVLSSEGSPLHDWLYPFPRIAVLRRVEGQPQ